MEKEKIIIEEDGIEYLKSIMLRCIKESNRQKRLFYMNKIIYSSLMMPAILLPIIVANLEGKVERDVLSGLLITTSSITAILGFFKFDQKAAQNSKYSQKFTELQNDIEGQISKKLEDRIDQNVYAQKVLDAYNHFQSQSPDC